MGPESTLHHGIPSLELAHLRDMLILSLPRENVSLHQDRRKLKELREAGSRPSSAARGGTMHWFAYVGPDPPALDEEDREVRLRNLKERQNEERQKKLEEIKAQALAAQRYKEQKEAERRQRFEELRLREDSRRQQVEERKRAINEAERDRLDAILRRNQEREARIEARKRHDRHSLVFAFGSSTPRMLDPAPEGGSFWGHRRATSTQNITCSLPAGAPGACPPLTRRQSERELDGGSKKRATSAGGLERSSEDALRMTSSMYEIFGSGGQVISGRGINLLTRSSSAHFGTPPSTPAGCVSGYVGRRRTDLMPTIPTKDPSSPAGGGAGRNNKAFARSPASSRPGSALSQQSTTSVTSSVNLRVRPIAAPRRPRPASIAVTGVTTALQDKSADKTTKPPLPKSRKSSLVKTQDKPKKKPLVSPTEGSTPKSVASPTTQVAPPIAAQNEEGSTNIQPIETHPSPPAAVAATTTIVVEETQAVKIQQDNIKSETQQKQEIITNTVDLLIDLEPTNQTIDEPLIALGDDLTKTEDSTPAPAPAPTAANNVGDEKHDVDHLTAIDGDQSEIVDMTASMIKVRINTEEEAKAALAERRRLAREEAERQAEAERLRIEEENRLEFERQQREEEQQRLLIEQMRAAEQERLEEAIRETQRREEEERLRREEENRQKLLKEEADKKAREEAERQKIELAKRLEHEEKEREARRKRVEAIMLRTRGKNSTPQQTEENSEHSEKVNGSNSENSENGHKNGKEIETVDNIIPVETLKNANTVNVDTLSTDDTLNSNNAWQRNNQQQSDLLM